MTRAVIPPPTAHLTGALFQVSSIIFTRSRGEPHELHGHPLLGMNYIAPPFLLLIHTSPSLHPCPANASSKVVLQAWLKIRQFCFKDLNSGNTLVIMA